MVYNESRKDENFMNSITDQLLHSILIFLNEPVYHVRHMVWTQP